jgi:hypothetical protein
MKVKIFAAAASLAAFVGIFLEAVTPGRTNHAIGYGVALIIAAFIGVVANQNK